MNAYYYKELIRTLGRVVYLYKVDLDDSRLDIEQKDVLKNIWNEYRFYNATAPENPRGKVSKGRVG